MEWLNPVILGLVEGVTEFLPVSSTGHLLVAEKLLGAPQTEAFNVLIQVGPVLASALVLRNRLARFVTDFRAPTIRLELLQILVAFLLTGVGGFLLKKAGLTLPKDVLPIAWASLAGVPLLFWMEARAKRSAPDPEAPLTWTIVAMVAVAQLAAAAFPGASRSGACVIAAMLLGAARPRAVEFSFLVGIPTMLAAGGYELLGVVKRHEAADLVAPGTLLAFAVALASAFLVVKWLLGWVRTRTFLPFAWYRLGFGILLLVLAFGFGWR